MIKTIVCVILAITLFSCTKQASNRLASEEITIADLKTKYKIDLIAEWERYSVLSRSNRPKPKAEQVVSVWLEDLVLSGSVECTVSSNAQWGGIQKFLAVPLSMDGAISYCNFYFTIPAPMICQTTASGVYRGWTSDIDYTVHTSNLITIQ